MTVPVTCKPRWMAGSGGQKSVMLSREPYKSLFGWIAAQIPVQPHKCSAFGLRGVAVRMHWSTAADQPKSYESCLTVVTLIEGVTAQPTPWEKNTFVSMVYETHAIFMLWQQHPLKQNKSLALSCSIVPRSCMKYSSKWRRLLSS